MERRQPISRSVLQILAINLLTVASANAADGRQVDVAERTRGAHKVVVASAVSVAPEWRTTPRGDRLIVSTVALKVDETFKGAAANVMWLEMEGGTIDGVTLAVSSQPAIRKGERAVFFLDQTTSGTHVPHLKGMGILKLDATGRIQGSNLRLEDVRRLVLSAR